MTALRKYAGMTDDQMQNEYMAQAAWEQAKADMRRAILLVNNYSSVVEIKAEAFEAFIHDETTSARAWDEKIAEARRG